MSIGGEWKDMVAHLNQTLRRSVEGNLRKGNQEGRPVLFTTPEIKLGGLTRSEKALRAGCNKPRQTKVSAALKAGCHGGQAVARNRGGLRCCDARQGAAAKSGPV